MNNYPTHLKILAIDLGSKTGWASITNGIVTHGLITLIRRTGRKTKPDDHPGTKYNLFRKWLASTVILEKPDLIVYEKVMGHSQSTYAQMLNYGMRGILLAIADNKDIPVLSITQTELKKFATGKGNANKDDMMAAAAKKWPSEAFESDDVVDARYLLEKAILEHSWDK
jgi:Holliday junction resolvasome RuvABC endonuclease subunit